MNVLIGLGTNQGDRMANLTAAALRLRTLSRENFLKVSPVFENPPLLPPGAPDSWRMNFLNAVAQIRWNGSANHLLIALQNIETELGRTRNARWSPRTIDLDLLDFGGQKIQSRDLKLPHPEMLKRQFVLTPLKHLGIPGMLARSRALNDPLPMWMGILNLTPDSFSDGGRFDSHEQIEQQIQNWENEGVHILDLGAESTRPSAQRLTAEQEWSRLQPTLRWLRERYHARLFRPLISVDTYHTETAIGAVELGADIINDVSGLADERLIEVLKHSPSQYVLMHSRGIPAVAGDHWEVADVVASLKHWALESLERLEREGVSLTRVIFDPGIGFGKSAAQSLEILRRLEEFLDLPVRVLIGHSRKSFMNLWGKKDAKDRDPETLALSLRLAARGADILRVHRPDDHTRAWHAFQEI